MTTTKPNWLNRSLSLLLALVMCMSMISVTAFAAESNTDKLDAGVYTVPITSLTSAAPLQPVQTAFNKAFGESVTVTVEENGAMTARIKNYHMVIDFAGMMGLGAFDANVAWIKDANVLSTKQETWSNVNGVLTAEPVATEITVPDEFEIVLALDESNAQKLTVGVDFMAGMNGKSVDEYSTTVTLTLDMANAEKQVDKSALEALVADAKEYQSDNYTDDSFAALQSEIKKAAELLASDTATQEDINNAVKALQAAIDALEEKKLTEAPKLEAGIYTVPIVSLTSAAPLQPVQAAFNKAFGESVTVIVDENGTMTARIKNYHMVIDFAGMMGLGAFDANVAWVKDANVLSTKQETWSNVNGVLTAEPVATEITVPDEFEIVLALDESNAQKLTVGVDFMAGMYGKSVDEYSTTVTLMLDMANAEKVEPEVDVSALESLVVEAKKYQSNNYTSESFAALQNEIKKAEEVLASDTATQEDIDNAVKSLQAAIDALEEKKQDDTTEPEDPAKPDDPTTPDDPQTPGTSDDETIDIKNLKDDIYEIPVALWHATQDQASMAASSLNSTARLVVKDGKITLYIYTKPMTFGTITASLQEMKIEQADGSWVDAVIEDRSDDGNPICFSMTISELAEFINVKVNPHVEMMGNMDLDARLKFDLSGIKLISQPTEDKPLTPPEETNSGTSDDGNNSQNGDNSETVKSPQTGDNSHLALWLLLMLCSVAGMIGITVFGKKKVRTYR